VDRRQLDVPWQVIDIGAIALDTCDLTCKSSIITISLFCTVSEILAIITSRLILRGSRDPQYDIILRSFMIHLTVLIIINLCTEFEMSSIGRCTDILRVPKF